MADRSDADDGAASRADAVDRLERVINTQIDTVDDFDQKAAYVTRFVGVVLGLVLTAVSLASRFGGGDPATQLPAVAAVAGGVVGLVAAVAGAIVTYLSSRVVVGLHPHAARAIADGEYGGDETTRCCSGRTPTPSSGIARCYRRTRAVFAGLSSPSSWGSRTSRWPPCCSRSLRAGCGGGSS